MRTFVFIDGQNLYHLAKDAWGGNSPSGAKTPYLWPSYDVGKLARALVAKAPGRELSQIRFYTGVPDPRAGVKQRFWSQFWTAKLREMRTKGVHVYRGRVNSGGQEKGVDVSLALDLVRAAYEQLYDCAIIVSQDSDFKPAVDLVHEIARTQGRKPLIESAFPFGPGSSYRRGVPGTTWKHIDKDTYDACLDARDYRPESVETPQGDFP